jgi:TonB family protein
MRFPEILITIGLTFFLATVAPAAEPASKELHVFSGEVIGVNPAAQTLTIKSGGKSFVFHITPETKLSSDSGHIRLDTIQRGQGATVVMRLGAGNIGIAVKVLILHDATGSRITSYYSAKTIDGDTVHGNAVGNYVAFEPPPDEWSTSLEYRRHNGAMFILTVQRDGTVSEVKPVATLGYPELDARAIRYFKRWKFKPNTVTEVRMPLIYSRTSR